MSLCENNLDVGGGVFKQQNPLCSLCENNLGLGGTGLEAADDSYNFTDNFDFRFVINLNIILYIRRN